MSTIVSNISVFNNRDFPFKKIKLSDNLEKRNRKFYVDYTIDDQAIFFQINNVILSSEPIFIDDEQGYIDIEIKERLAEISHFFEELDNFNQISCFKNCEDWLGKNITIEELENVYKTSFKKNLLRIKIERDNISIFDFKRNKLSLDKDIKVGDVLDIIVEISGLKVMKNSFATHLILRQIRKHPKPVLTKKKVIPNEYLFLDDTTRHSKKNIDDISLDSQTDVDVLVNARKTKILPTKPIPLPKVEVIEKSEDLDISLSELKDPEDNHICKSEDSNIESKHDNPFDIEKEDENTKDYLKSVEKLKNIMSDIFDEPSSPNRKGNDSVSLSTIQSEKTHKKPSGNKRGGAKTDKNQELYKNL